MKVPVGVCVSGFNDSRLSGSHSRNDYRYIEVHVHVVYLMQIVPQATRHLITDLAV